MDVGDGGLVHFELFAGLTESEILAIEQCCTWQRFAAGDQVFDRESDTLDVYFIVSGAVRILTQAEDREVALADVVAGNYFGECSR